MITRYKTRAVSYQVHAQPRMSSFKPKQKGTIIPIVAAASLMLLTMVGMAVDFGRLYGVRNSLHQAVDAAALAGAQTMSKSDSTAEQAQAAAQAAYDAYALGAGNSAIQNVKVTTVFSQKMPFQAITTKAPFVKVTASLPADYWLLRVAGKTQTTFNAESTAGPSMVEICGNLPIMACGTESTPITYGYTTGQVYNLLADPSSLGPGNFGLINVGTKQTEWVEWTSGARNTCLPMNIETEITTVPGGKVGPLEKCLNSRFNNNTGCQETSGFATPPRDINTCEDNCLSTSGGGHGGGSGQCTQINYTYSQYAVNAACTTGKGAYPSDTPNKAKRRMVRLVIGQCGDINGRKVVYPFGSGCFFIRNQYDSQGADKQLKVEYIGPCPSGFDDSISNKITLYKSN